jgi:hypothetical protein
MSMHCKRYIVYRISYMFRCIVYPLHVPRALSVYNILYMFLVHWYILYMFLVHCIKYPLHVPGAVYNPQHIPIVHCIILYMFLVHCSISSTVHVPIVHCISSTCSYSSLYILYMFLVHCSISRAGHVERYQLQSYRFKHFFVTL